MDVTEVGEDGQPKRQHTLPSKFTMFIPGFRWVSCMMGEDGKGLAGLANPRGFILVDKCLLPRRSHGDHGNGGLYRRRPFGDVCRASG